MAHPTKSASGTFYLASIIEAVGLLQQLTHLLDDETVLSQIRELDRSTWSLLDVITELTAG